MGMVLAFYAAFGILITLLSVKAFSGMVSLIGTLPALYDSYGRVCFMEILQQLEAFFVNMEPGIATILDEIGTNLIGSLGNLISSLSVSFMGFATGVASAVSQRARRDPHLPLTHKKSALLLPEERFFFSRYGTYPSAF